MTISLARQPHPTRMMVGLCQAPQRVGQIACGELLAALDCRVRPEGYISLDSKLLTGSAEAGVQASIGTGQIAKKQKPRALRGSRMSCFSLKNSGACTIWACRFGAPRRLASLCMAVARQTVSNWGCSCSAGRGRGLGLDDRAFNEPVLAFLAAVCVKDRGGQSRHGW